MVITDDFVLLAFPKTGTTFTTAVLRNIHARRRFVGRVIPPTFQKWLFKKCGLSRPGMTEYLIDRSVRLEGEKQRKSRHGTYSDIPKYAQDRSIVSVVRDPFAIYTSAYIFQTRMRKQLRVSATQEELKERYPNYPDLSFEEYYEIKHEYESAVRLQGVVPQQELGLHTINFILFYFKDPVSVFKKINSDYIESGEYKKDIADIKFLHQESLRSEFKAVLESSGYSREECESVELFATQNVASRDENEKDISAFYSPELRAKVLAREALFFDMFPEYIPKW